MHLPPPLLVQCLARSLRVLTPHRTQLSVYDPKEELPVSKFPLSILPEAHPSINCFQALDYLCVCLFPAGRH